MALTTSRRSVVRGAPTGTAGGTSGARTAHSAFVRSLGYGLRRLLTSMPDPPGVKGRSNGQALFCPKHTKLSRGIRLPPPLLTKQRGMSPTPPRLELEQVAARTQHAEHSAEGAEGHVRGASRRARGCAAQFLRRPHGANACAAGRSDSAAIE